MSYKTLIQADNYDDAEEILIGNQQDRVFYKEGRWIISLRYNTENKIIAKCHGVYVRRFDGNVYRESF